MPKYERDTHEPDDVRVFDGGGDDEDEGGSHLPVVIVISLLVLAAFGGVVWLAYNNGVARGRADVPVSVVAQNAPKEQPAVAPGSGTIPPKQIKIYQQQAGSEDDADQQIATAPPAQLAAPTPALRSQPAEAKPAVQPPPVREATAKPAPVKHTALPLAAPAVKPAVQTPAKQPAATAPKPAASVVSGAYLLQVGAYKSQSDADAAWRTYRAKHAALLAGLGPNVQKADLGDKGVWYRLRVGSFADKDAAAAMCNRLKVEGATCFPAK